MYLVVPLKLNLPPAARSPSPLLLAPPFTSPLFAAAAIDLRFVRRGKGAAAAKNLRLVCRGKYVAAAAIDLCFVRHGKDEAAIDFHFVCRSKYTRRSPGAARTWW